MILENSIDELEGVIKEFRNDYQCLPVTVGEALAGMSRQELTTLVAALLLASYNVINARKFK